MIRLSMAGKKHSPHYKIVVLEKRSKRDGKTVANLGHWNPGQKHLVVDRNVYKDWIGKGAIASSTVRKLLTQDSSTFA